MCIRDRLTDSAFNALLKTLEEPPAHAVFILATTEPHKIPATILSRCMRLDFKLIPEEDLEKHLAGILDEMGRAYEPEAVAAIARAGAGSDRDMLSIAEMCLAYGDKLTYAGVTGVLGSADFATNAAIVSAMLSSDLGGTLAAAECVLGEGKGVGVVLRDLLELLNRVAVVKSCPNAEKLLSLPKEMFSEIRRIADGSDGAAILRATDILVGVEAELRFASSPRISLETALLRIAMPREDRDTDALLARIAVLERQVAELSSGAPRAAAAQPAPSAASGEEPAPRAADLPPVCEPARMSFTNTSAFQSTAPKFSSTLLPFQAAGTLNVRRYQSSSFSVRPFCTPDSEDSTAKGTRIFPSIVFGSMAPTGLMA